MRTPPDALALFFGLIAGPVLAAGVWGWSEGPVSGRRGLTTGDAIPDDATNVVFAAGEVEPGPLLLGGRKLRFVAAKEGTTVLIAGDQGGFDLSGATGDWTFSGVSFRRETGIAAGGPADGGAIRCCGGRLNLEGCTFDGLTARFTGGAVSAYLMDGDVIVSNCTFTGNAAGPLNGMGGALYVSRSADGLGGLLLNDSSFAGNSAQNGGAISTARVIDANERPMPAEIGGCEFRGNSADYSGGAIDDEGAFGVTNTLFEANGAAIQGGAIYAGTSDPEWPGTELRLDAGTVFRGNSATNFTEDSRCWTSGGAVALVGAGYSLSASGRHVVFERNRAASASSSYGGAISAADGTAVDVSCAAFLANSSGTAGGAISFWGDRLGVSASIFSNNVVTAADGCGGAVFVESGAEFAMVNSTVRGSSGNAVDAYLARTRISNCVVADNGRVDVFVGGTGATLAADHTAFGRAEVEDGVSVSTNSCLSGAGASTYRGASLCLSDGAYNPVAALGLVQVALDYDGVAYGSRPEGYSMGAFECPTHSEGYPVIELAGTTWYHNRSDGLYYPRLEIRLAKGDASRITGLTLTCGGIDHELPQACVDRLKTATVGERIFFGVDPSAFVQYPDSPANWGFVPLESRLFGVYGAGRPIGFSLSVKGTLHVAAVVSVPRAVRLPAAVRRPATVPVAARFAEFRVGERLSGRVETVIGGMIRLLGCATLGGEWRTVVDGLEVDADGGFSVAVPEGLRFFRLEAEVPR